MLDYQVGLKFLRKKEQAKRSAEVTLPDNKLTEILYHYFRHDELEDHAKRLLQMLTEPNPCDYCPGNYCWYKCRLCKTFIGLSTNSDCPCSHLGRSEAIKRTWLALEQHGFLEEEG